MSERSCANCHTPLINKRSHAKYCSDRCRVKQWRAYREDSVHVSFRLPVAHHIDLFLAAYSVKQTVDTYLNKLVSNHLDKKHLACNQ